MLLIVVMDVANVYHSISKHFIVKYFTFKYPCVTANFIVLLFVSIHPVKQNVIDKKPLS